MDAMHVIKESLEVSFGSSLTNEIQQVMSSFDTMCDYMGGHFREIKDMLKKEDSYQK